MKKSLAYLERMTWALGVILALGFGIFAGHSVTAAYKDVELMNKQAALETALASLADANVELKQNQATVITWDTIASFYTEASSGKTQANGKRFNEKEAMEEWDRRKA